MTGRVPSSPKLISSFTQKSTRTSSSSSLSFALSPSWTGECFLRMGDVRDENLKMDLFSVDICQFSVTSLWNTSEDKHRSISFRSIILIMIYAGTIILNLLAASVDNTFSPVRNQPPENSTLMEATESNTEKETVIVLLFAERHQFTDENAFSGQRRNDLSLEHIVNRS